MIIAACVKHGNYIGVGHSHSNAIGWLMDFDYFEYTPELFYEYGFLDDKFNYLTREQSHEVAFQKLGRLTSEMMNFTESQISVAKQYARAHNEKVKQNAIPELAEL